MNRQKILKLAVVTFLVMIATLYLAPIVSAHEIYLLSPEEIHEGLTTVPASPFETIKNNLNQFVFWGLITFIILATVFFVSISRGLERLAAPLIARTKSYAPKVIRVAAGAALTVGAYYGAIFGPELPLAPMFGVLTNFVSISMGIIGILIVAGVYVRTGALVGIVIYAIVAYYHGLYALTYTEYLGVFIFLFAGDGEVSGKRNLRFPSILESIGDKLRPYRFAIMRGGFGLAIMFAAIYAKMIHANLALILVEKYDLTSYALFAPFEPHFLVLGTAIVELLLGFLLVIGMEIRHTSAFLAFWLTLSLLFFGESVWPHIILFGLGFTFLLYGYDKYSLEGRFFKRDIGEPVL